MNFLYQGFKILLLLCFLGINTTSLSATTPIELTILSSDFPPYSFVREGKPAGMSTEIVLATVKEAGLKVKELRIFPWARAYAMAQESPNTLIYSIARSKKREKLFQWVGTIAPYSIYLYRLKSRTDIQINSLEDAKQYIIGGEFKDIKQQYLVDHGFVIGKNIILVSRDELNLRKLMGGRIDLLPFSQFALPPMLESMGYPRDALEKALFLEGISSELYLATSPTTDPETVSKLKNALTVLKKNGLHSKIQGRYLK